MVKFYDPFFLESLLTALGGIFFTRKGSVSIEYTNLYMLVCKMVLVAVNTGDNTKC